MDALLQIPQTGGCENMASQLLEVKGFRISQPHVDYITVRKTRLPPGPRIFFATDCFVFLLEVTVAFAPRKQAMRVVPDLNKITDRVHKPSSREILPPVRDPRRRPHDDGDAMASTRDFQRLFGGQAIILVSLSRAVDAPDRNFSDRSGKQR